MSAPDRAAYAARQAQLLEALLRGGDPPNGVAAAQADAAGRSLRRKRERAVARAWPALAIDLGDTFGAHFDAFARTTDAPMTGGPLADGLAFARWVAARGRLDDDARVELLLARAALARCGPFVRVVRLCRPHARLLLVARLPWTGTIHHSVRASRRHDDRPSQSPAQIPASSRSAATPDRLSTSLMMRTRQRVAAPMASPPTIIHKSSNTHTRRLMMTEQQPATNGPLARWRERRRAKRQQALERQYFQQERLSPTTRAYTDTDNHARRWTSFLGGSGDGGGAAPVALGGGAAARHATAAPDGWVPLAHASNATLIR